MLILFDLKNPSKACSGALVLGPLISLDLKNENKKEYAMVGSSQLIKSLKKELKQLSDRNSRILLTGDLGAGKEARNIKEIDAPEHILGYCIVNDISEREWQIEKLGQWTKGKSADTFGPTGPFLVTKDEIEDLNNLSLILKVNDQVMQFGRELLRMH